MTERVMIGDATLYHGRAEDVLPTLDAHSADMIFTDPPYGHNNNNGDLIHRRESALGHGPHGEARAIANDGAEANEVFRAVLPEMNRLLSPGCCCCCCCSGGGGPDPQFARWSLWMDEVFAFKQLVLWDKGRMGMGWHYRRSYEIVLVAQVTGAKCRWYDDTGRVENVIRSVGKIIPQATQHPTQKPVELAQIFIRLHSLPGHVVCDPFMGSGTTGVAAIGMGRRFVGIDQDRQWFDLACRRIAAAQAQLRLGI